MESCQSNRGVKPGGINLKPESEKIERRTSNVQLAKGEQALVRLRRIEHRILSTLRFIYFNINSSVNRRARKTRRAALMIERLCH